MNENVLTKSPCTPAIYRSNKSTQLIGATPTCRRCVQLVAFNMLLRLVAGVD